MAEGDVVRCLLKARRINHPWEGFRGAIIAGMASFFYVAQHIYRVGGTGANIALYGGVTAFIASIVFNALIRLYIRRAFVRSVRANPALYTAPQELSFDRAKPAITSPVSRNEFAWTLFKRGVQDEHYLYLLSGPGGFFVIVPKRAFAAPDLAEFLRGGESLLGV